jgi:hypothetical protein
MPTVVIASSNLAAFPDGAGHFEGNQVAEEIVSDALNDVRGRPTA